MIYSILSSYIEHHNITFLHETSVAILVGFCVSLFAELSGNERFVQMVHFDDSLFFYVCLPPIILATGFNMKKKNFFQNISYALLFGIVGTFVCFTVFTILHATLFYLIDMQKYNTETGVWSSFTLTFKENLLLSALICSSDIIAAISLISNEEHPKLASIIFGEGITNDAVAIILYKTVYVYTSSSETFTAFTPAIVMANFMKMACFSVILGVVVGILTALVLKHCRFMTSSNIQEILLMFSAGYIAYVTSEILEFSGIISLFTCGIMLIHYAYYNCSDRTKQTINLAFGTIGFGAEAFVFAYVGTSFFSFKSYDWSYQFIVFEFLFVLMARFCGSVGMFYTTSTIFCFERKISFNDVLFLNFAGVIRGAIAFGLVLRLDPELDNRGVIVTTVLTLVIATTVIFGAIMTILKVALLNEPVNALMSSSSESDEPRENLADYLQVNEPFIRRQKSTNRSFAGSYTENKFSTSFQEGMDVKEIDQDRGT